MNQYKVTIDGAEYFVEADNEADAKAGAKAIHAKAGDAYTASDYVDTLYEGARESLKRIKESAQSDLKEINRQIQHLRQGFQKRVKAGGPDAKEHEEGLKSLKSAEYRINKDFEKYVR